MMNILKTMMMMNIMEMMMMMTTTTTTMMMIWWWRRWWWPRWGGSSLFQISICPGGLRRGNDWILPLHTTWCSAGETQAPQAADEHNWRYHSGVRSFRRRHLEGWEAGHVLRTAHEVLQQPQRVECLISGGRGSALGRLKCSRLHACVRACVSYGVVCACDVLCV